MLYGCIKQHSTFVMKHGKGTWAGLLYLVAIMFRTVTLTAVLYCAVSPVVYHIAQLYRIL